MNRLELKAAVDTYLHRALSDADFDLFLLQAESDIAQQVRSASMEIDVRLDDADRPGGAAYSLPVDFIEMRFASIPGKYELKPVAALDKLNLNHLSGPPSGYFLSGQASGFEMTVVPTPAEGAEIFILYFAKPAALAAPTDTNALITNHPSLYIYSCVMYAYDWARNYEQREAASNRFVAKIEEINAIDQRRRYGPSVSVGNNQDFGAYGSTNGGM